MREGSQPLGAAGKGPEELKKKKEVVRKKTGKKKKGGCLRRKKLRVRVASEKTQDKMSQ